MKIKNIFNRYDSEPHPSQTPKYNMPITAEALKNIFDDCSDFQDREIAVGGSETGLVTLCYIDGLVNGGEVGDFVVRPLTDKFRLDGHLGARKCIDSILKGAVYNMNVSEKDTMDDVVEMIVKGFCVVIFDKENIAIAFETRSPLMRGIAEPNIEKAVKGGKDTFIEIMRVNTMLVRRRLRTPNLKVLRKRVGRRSDTEIAIAYVEGIANPKTVDELSRRMDTIDIDGVLATGNLEEYISDSPNSPFPQVMYTERPDRFATNLLEGRVGLIVDGLPLGLLVPGTLSEIMRAPEDRSQHYTVSSFLRTLRYISLFVSVLLPAFYVAITTFHQEMIPIRMLMSLIESKTFVPFSTVVEVVAMLIAFELLQEAGFRLPSPVGETIGIIGGLIVGEAVILAEIVSAVAVVVVALSAITGYTVPNQDMSSALRLCRFFLVFCAIAGGLFGIACGALLIIYHLCSINSFGVPYLSPAADGGPLGFLSFIFRPPARLDKLREEQLKTPDKRNQI